MVGGPFHRRRSGSERAQGPAGTTSGRPRVDHPPRVEACGVEPLEELLAARKKGWAVRNRPWEVLIFTLGVKDYRKNEEWS